MKRQSILVLASLVSFAVTNQTFSEQIINYPDFSDTTGLTLSYRAAELTGSDNRLHIQDGRFQMGVAITTTPMVLKEMFSTHFQFQIFNTVERFGPGSGADWLLFTLQTEDGIYGESGNSIGVEFDIWNNGARDNYSGNHIGVNINYNLESAVTQHVSPDFNNEQVWNAWIDYDGSNLEIFASNSSTRPELPYISYSSDIISILGTSNVYLGFVAASGQEGADFDVLSWTFETHPIPAPGALELACIGFGFVSLLIRRRT